MLKQFTGWIIKSIRYEILVCSYVVLKAHGTSSSESLTEMFWNVSSVKYAWILNKTNNE